MQFESGEELCEYVSEATDGVAILAFSTGKDSVASWLQMRRYFKKIVPVYMWLAPNLSFVERSLTYYEDFFETRIIRLPHPSLYRMINNLVFQAPENCAVVEEAGLPEFDYLTINQIVREDCGLPENTYAASGVRARDSLNRWTAIKKYGPLHEGRKTFFPIFDWDKARMVRELRMSGVRLPVDYRMFGRSFDGIDYRFATAIKKHYPADYEKILALFPLLELEIKRIEYRREYYNREGSNE